MKIFCAILSICLVGALAELTEEENDKFSADRAACIKETGIDPVHLENSEKEALDEKDEKLACFIACYLKKMGMMNSDGSINDELYEAKARVRGGIPKDKAAQILSKCKAMKGDNECQTAVQILKCLQDEDKKF